MPRDGHASSRVHCCTFAKTFPRRRRIHRSFGVIESQSDTNSDEKVRLDFGSSRWLRGPDGLTLFPWLLFAKELDKGEKLLSSVSFYLAGVVRCGMGNGLDTFSDSVESVQAKGFQFTERLTLQLRNEKKLH